MILFKVYLIMALSSIVPIINAQDSVQIINKNSISLELGGSTFFYSINYEHIVKHKEKWNLLVRGGLMYLNFFRFDKRQMFGMPVELAYLRGRENNYLELGLGITSIYDTYRYNLGWSNERINDLALITTLRIGYRYQKKNSAIFYKIALLPLAGVVIDLNESRDVRYQIDYMEKFAYPWIGAGVGWTIRDKKYVRKQEIF